MKTMLPIILMSCQGDIGLIYTDKRYYDTAETDQEDYSAEPSTDYDSADNESYIDPSGVSGYFKYELQQIACPACFGLSREITVSFEGFFHEPITDSHFQGSLQAGQCSTSDYVYRPSYNLINHSSNINLSGNIYNFNVYNSGMNYYTDQIYETQYERDVEYSVETDSGSFSFISTHGFDFIEPYDMFYVDPSYSFATPISRSGQSFSWGPSGSNSLFEVSLEVFNSSGSQLLGVVTCSGNDSGYITIPSSYLQTFPQNSLVAVILTRHKRDSSLYEPLNSFIETHMVWRVVGTGFIY